MSVFPLTVIEKEDSPARLLELANVAEKNKWLATDFNQILAAIKELHGRSFYLADANGKKWYVRKGDGNEDTGAFQVNDKIEAWVDDASKEEWIEGILMNNDFTGVADLDNKDRFFKTNGKIRLT